MGVVALMHDDSYMIVFAFWICLSSLVVSGGLSCFRSTALPMGAPTRVQGEELLVRQSSKDVERFATPLVERGKQASILIAQRFHRDLGRRNPGGCNEASSMATKHPK